MKKINSLTLALLFALTFIVGQSQQSLPEGKIRYPNELQFLKLYQEAKWKSIVPYVSTEADVERILGAPGLLYEEDTATWVYGYDYDPDWAIVVSYVGDPVDSIVGRVAEITLRPKRRVSMREVTFPSTFRRGDGIDGSRNARFVAYQDEFGLTYLVNAKDRANRGFRAGDLDSISYGPSDEEEEKHKTPSESKPKPNMSLKPTALQLVF